MVNEEDSVLQGSMERTLEMFPNNEQELVDAAREHIESASIADGLQNDKVPTPGNELREKVGTGSEADIVGAAMEHIEDAAIADGRAKR